MIIFCIGSQVKVIDGNKVSFEITFQVSFVKSTYMKYIIERSTNGEMSKWLETFAAQIKKTVDNYKNGSLSLSSSDVSTSETPSSKESDSVPQKVVPETASPSSTNKASSEGSVVAPSPSVVPSSAPQTSSPYRDYLVLALLALLVILLSVDFLRWRNVDAEMRDLRSKLAAMESLVNSIARSP